MRQKLLQSFNEIQIIITDKTSYLHDFGPDGTQHMFQALSNANICTAVHMAVHWDDLTEK